MLRAGAAEPVAARQPKIKLSCNLYSFNEPLRSGAMTLEQAIDFCAELGFDAVDPTGYYFPGIPRAPKDAYVHAIKRQAFLNGLGVSGTGVRNDFTQPEAEKRAADVAHVKRWVEVAASWVRPALRVFDGRAEAKGPSREQMTGWVAEGVPRVLGRGRAARRHDRLPEPRRAAEDGGRGAGAARARRIPWFGLNVDIGSLRTGDPYDEVERLAPYACTWQIKERLDRRGRRRKTDLRRVFGILKAAGYRGYAPLETLGPGEPREKLRRFLAEVREALA